MSAPITLPQWGMGMNDGEVIKWLKAVGDPVAKGDQLVEIESSKVNAEVEATADGTLGRIDVEEGRVVDVLATVSRLPVGDKWFGLEIWTRCLMQPDIPHGRALPFICNKQGI